MLTSGMLTLEEREWVTAGMAWVAVQHWLCGRQQADEARDWFMAQMDARFDRAGHGHPCHITPDMERLSGELKSRLTFGLADAGAGCA